MIYSSGYASSLTIKLIRTIAEKAHIESIYHCGDIDAFGFYILRSNSIRTGIKMVPYKMDLETYQKYKQYAIPMKVSHEKLFGSLFEDQFFSEQDKELFGILLEDQLLLEQESIQGEYSAE